MDQGGTPVDEEERCPACGAPTGWQGIEDWYDNEVEKHGEQERALVCRIGILSNALEVAFRQLSEDQERSFNPDREIVTGLVYLALNPDEKPEGDESE